MTIPSFAKINLGLRIGTRRTDGFHELRTVYQTIALHDVIRVSIGRGTGIEIRCDDPRVPTDSTNTCWQIVERAMQTLKARGSVIIEIEKRLPVQGGLGGASGNAVAALLALERVLGKEISGPQRFSIAAEVGSDLPLFLIGGTVLGVGRGEEVYPLPGLPVTACVIAVPEIAVSTPKAFADWDRLTSIRRHSEPAFAGEEPIFRQKHIRGEEKQVPRFGNHSQASDSSSPGMTELASDWKLESVPKLTEHSHSDRMLKFSREISAWLGAAPKQSRRRSGVSASGGGRAENPLLDLVRTGIENDFERVVFPQYPELRKVKSVLDCAGAQYASLSGSGSAIYGLFDSSQKAAAAAKKLERSGTRAVVTSTLTRQQYWKRLRAASS
jgi:4-diphosphocytidyl-2-C-methyl-D-erythritol kinase